MKYNVIRNALLVVLLAIPAAGYAGDSPKADDTGNIQPHAGAMYDGQGRVIRKANDTGGVSEYTYHPQSGKLIRFVNNGRKTEFRYDERGNLIRAESDNGQMVELDYANTQQIRHMVDVNPNENTRRELIFNYNAAGRPVEITLVGTGKIVIEYDEKGEISKVDSNGDIKIALKVMQAFQNLLSLVKVAGVNF